MKSLSLRHIKSRTISGWSELTSLQNLTINYTILDDFSFLTSLYHLNYLNLADSNFSSPRLISANADIAILDLSRTNVRNIRLLEHFKNLQFLWLDGLELGKQNLPSFKNTALTYLSMSEVKVEDLNFLKRFPRLNYLNLTDVIVDDYAPIADLPDLTTLILTGTKIDDLSYFKQKNLKTLLLNDTKISNLNKLPYSYYTLNHLDLRGTLVEDASPLKKINWLDWLLLSNSKIKDLSQIPVSKYLDLRGFDDASLASTRLHYYYIATKLPNILHGKAPSNNRETNFIYNPEALIDEEYFIPSEQTDDFVHQKRGDKKIQFMGGDFWVDHEDITVCYKPDKLEYPLSHFCHNKNYADKPLQTDQLLTKAELAKLTEFKNLKKLQLINFPNFDPSELPTIHNLVVLDLNRTKITKDKPFNHQEKIQFLILDESEIKDLVLISNFTSLKVLSLRHTPLTSLVGLENVSKLEALDLSFTKIKDFKNLENLTKLETLLLANTAFNKLSILNKMGRLTNIDLSNVAALDLSDLKTKTMKIKIGIAEEKLTPLYHNEKELVPHNFLDDPFFYRPNDVRKF
ncbi:leucine-rich repeat domain-containing protein [Bartonella sp. HY038]|uniref:leucine-rich repeat domain-containing protein n=1 Tax=Bartonella sp. HY038 TaxID=2759660 RepID=UPI0015FC20BE|nr:leucine-rich repeat domain-containing protein [Bartonella sp. HY038]